MQTDKQSSSSDSFIRFLKEVGLDDNAIYELQILLSVLSVTQNEQLLLPPPQATY